MTKQRSTKRALLMSALSLLLCVSMLVGTTYAWFTDEVVSGMNTIQAGNLDVELMANGTEVKAETKLFSKVANWEPGVVVYENLQIVNKGTLALKYQMSLNFGNENDLYGHKLSEVLKVAVIDKIENADRATVLAAAKAATNVGSLYDFFVAGELEAGKSSTEQAVVIFWEPGENDNLYNANNGKTTSNGKPLGIEFGVNLQATQKMSESDSFGTDYDKDAWSKGFAVYSAPDLQTAINNGEANITVMADFAASESIVIPAGKSVAINLNGKTITGTMQKNAGAVIKNDGTLTLANGTVENTAVNGESVIINNGTMTLKATVKGAPLGDGDYPGYAVYNAGDMTIEEGADISSDRGALTIRAAGNTVINGGTFTNNDIGERTLTSHVVDLAAVHNLVINGGNFRHLFTKTSGGVVICNRAKTTITVNGGSFSGGSYYGNDNLSDYGYGGTFSVTGGTFSAKPAAKYIAAGYELVDNGNGTWTVGAYKVDDASELADAIAAGKAAALTQDITLGKIDLTAATKDVVIDANGHKITTTDFYGIEATPGKNITISNAEVEMTKEGDYINYAAGFKIANGDYAGATITLENCTITMANEDWAYAVTMPASVQNLNLVIDNCTLEGAIAVQCWGDGNTVTITNSELICNYTTSALYTSYCVVLQNNGSYAAENNTLVIDNCKFSYSGTDNFDSSIYSVKDLGIGNTVTVTNCTYGAKVVA